MKIRSDFVTNSSSSSYGEVVIDNLVLLEILAKYKDMGTFGKGSYISIGSFHKTDDYGRPYLPDSDITTITPAFHTFCAHMWHTPSSLDNIIEEIINVLDDDNDITDDYNQELLNQLKEELSQREDEILKGFRTVKWYSREILYSGRFGCWEFKYDQENGEYYHEEETGCLDF
jgi:hypothetical protein